MLLSFIVFYFESFRLTEKLQNYTKNSFMPFSQIPPDLTTLTFSFSMHVHALHKPPRPPCFFLNRSGVSCNVLVLYSKRSACVSLKEQALTRALHSHQGQEGVANTVLLRNLQAFLEAHRLACCLFF